MSESVVFVCRCIHPDIHEYVKNHPGAMTIGVRIIREDILPDSSEVEIDELYYMSIASLAEDPESARRKMTLSFKSGNSYVFSFNRVNVCDEFDFESQFQMNCCGYT